MDTAALLNKPEFPRSAGYNHDWMLDNQMGPNALWLAEWLCTALELKPGMRVLDLGCGRAMSSVFLAREFGVTVWAADLWIGPEGNQARADAAGVADRVTALRMEAHAIPFAPAFFDAVVSVDSYHYFGTDVLYLNYLSRFVRTGGQIAVAVPGLMQAIDQEVPDHLLQPQMNGKPFWEADCWSFNTVEFWRTLWSRSDAVEAVQVDTMPDGWRHWRDFEQALESSGKGVFPSDAEALERDRGRYIGFVRMLARRSGHEPYNLYDPSLGVREGVDG